MPSEKQPAMNTTLIAVLVVGVLLAGGAYYFGRTSSAPAEAVATPTAAPSATPVPSPTPVIITDAGILRRIETTSILQTAIYRIDTVVRAKKEGSWFFNMGAENIILFVQGSVTAGIDLRTLDEDDIQIDQQAKTITIQLPEAKILTASLDGYTLETFEGKIPSKVDPTLLQEGLASGQERIAEIACTDNILGRATDEGKRALENLLGLIELEGFTVRVAVTPATGCGIAVDLAVTPTATP